MILFCQVIGIEHTDFSFTIEYRRMNGYTIKLHRRVLELHRFTLLFNIYFIVIIVGLHFRHLNRIETEKTTTCTPSILLSNLTNTGRFICNLVS